MSDVIRMSQVVKSFLGVVANDHIDFDVRTGEVHALLGENGAGKTTLMNILYGLYQPNSGEIFVRGNEVSIKSPKDAIALGIGMVHQHFMLIPAFTVTENIILGIKSPKEPLLKVGEAEERVQGLAKRYGLRVNPKDKISEISVGEQQRVEILKALYRNVDVLILDEPTSVLTPEEVGHLFTAIRLLTKEGRSVIFISHKLYEVMEISDRITVLRSGRKEATMEKNNTNMRKLATLMTGREVLFHVDKQPVTGVVGEVILEVDGLKALDDRGVLAVKGVSFSVKQGEILGVAAVAGNGQSELIEVITGLRKCIEGKVAIDGKDITNCRPRNVIDQKVAHVPEKRLEMGIVRNFNIAENLILGSYYKEPFSKNYLFNHQAISRKAEKLISTFKIKTPSQYVESKLLSGGNIQRLILARELSRDPRLLIAVRAKGVGVLLVSTDLDEILSLSDRIAVIYEGRIAAIVSATRANKEEIGTMMAGGKSQPSEVVE